MRGHDADDGSRDLSDLELLGRVRRGDAHAANQLIGRHLHAARTLGGEDLAASGREVLHRVKSGESLELPFRAAWLAQRLHGTTRVTAPPDEAVWAAYAGLPAPGRLALWHHAVEGETAHEIGALLGLEKQAAERELAASYAAVGVAAADLRAGLARVVLGDAAAVYLRARPAPEPIDRARPAIPLRPGVAVLTAAGLGIAATLVLALGRPDGVAGGPPGTPYSGAVVVPPTVLQADLVLRGAARSRGERGAREAEPVEAQRDDETGSAPSAPATLETDPVVVPGAVAQPQAQPVPLRTEEKDEPAEPLAEVALASGTVSVDAGLPSGPVAVTLPLTLPVPAVTLPALARP